MTKNHILSSRVLSVSIYFMVCNTCTCYYRHINGNILEQGNEMCICYHNNLNNWQLINHSCWINYLVCKIIRLRNNSIVLMIVIVGYELVRIHPAKNGFDFGLALLHRSFTIKINFIRSRCIWLRSNIWRSQKSAQRKY